MNEIPTAFNEGGVKLELLIAGWTGVALLAIVALCIAAFIFNVLDEDVLFFVGGMAALCGLIAGGTWLIMLTPYDGKYHHYYTVSGEVTSVSNVLTEASGDLTREPVVTLDSLDRPLVIDDSRAVELEGRDVVLRCTIGWNYQAADSYSCRIIDFGGAR